MGSRFGQNLRQAFFSEEGKTISESSTYNDTEILVNIIRITIDDVWSVSLVYKSSRILLTVTTAFLKVISFAI